MRLLILSSTAYRSDALMSASFKLVLVVVDVSVVTKLARVAGAMLAGPGKDDDCVFGG